MKLSTEPNWAVHEARAAHLREAPVYDRAWANLFRDAPAEAAASRLLLLIRGAATNSSRESEDVHRAWGRVICHLQQATGRRRLVVTAVEAAWAVRVAAAMPDHWGTPDVMDAAAALAAWCDDPGDPGLLQAAEALVTAVDAHSGMLARNRDRIRKRLIALRPEVPVGPDLDVTMICPDDGWSRAVRERAARWPDDGRGANLLLRHLAAATGSKPSPRWTERAMTLLEDPGATGLRRILVESAATAEPVITRYDDDSELTLLVSDRNADLLRAACWAAGALAADWAVPALHAGGGRSLWGPGLAANGYVASAKVPNACVRSLGVIGSEAAITCLLDLRRRVKQAGFHRLIDAALAVAAERAGLTLSELAERIVPSAGLEVDGGRQVTAGGTAAWVSIGAGWRVRTEWQTAGGRSPRRPADADAEAVSLVRLAAREVKAALAGDRSRLEGLLAEERSWPVADWRRWYLDHPVTGSLTRGLIWSFSIATGTVTGIPADSDLLDTPGGRHPIPAEATVRLWHPARADTAEVGRWRDYLVSAERAQPFRQAFREVYLIEPDDRYLCIVPASARSKVMLPSDGDQLLSLVLSKAVLLAADDKITDPAITRQLTLRCQPA